MPRNLRLFAPVLTCLALAACGDSSSPAKPELPASAPAASAQASATSSAAPEETAAVDPSAAPTASAAEGTSAQPTDPAAPTAVAGATAAPAVSATASAAASAAAGPDVQGEQKKGASFSAYLAAKPSYEKGKSGSVTAVIVAQAPYKINQEYPFKFKLGTAPAGLSFPEAVVRNVNRSKSQASISIPFSADAAGTYNVSGECSLSVCTDANCVIEKVPLAVAVKVQ